MGDFQVAKHTHGQDAQSDVTITVARPRRVVRFQLRPGIGEEGGIAGLDYQIVRDGAVVAEGRTDEKGDVAFEIEEGTTLLLRILDSEYELSLEPMADSASLAGVQQRLDALGYMTGYLLGPLDDAKRFDGVDRPETQRAITQFQFDQGLTPNGDVDGEARDALVRSVGK